MAVPEPGCCDGPNELLRKILIGLNDISVGGGSPVEVDDEGVPLTFAVTSIDFVGAGVTATAVGNDVTVTIPGTSTDMQSGVTNITSGLDKVTVVFPVAFLSVPNVVVTIMRPTGNPMLNANIDTASLTATGFIAQLSALAPNANYKIQWMARV